MELVSMMHNTEQMKPDTDGNPVDVKKNVIPQTMYPLFQAFLFWITVFGCVALLIGFVTPGWLCAHVTMMTTVIDDQDFYSDATNVKHTLVYQNYGLWYVIQCELLEEGDECDTRSYSIITSMDHGINDNMKIPNIDNEPNLYFNGNGIVFSFSTLRGLEVMYTIAIVFSLYILYSLYYVRKQRQQNALSKLRWTFLSFLALVSGLLRQTAEFDYIRNFNLRKWSLTQMVTPWTLRKMSHRKLMFNYTFLRNTEIMYTTALALSLYILYCLYCVRKQEQKHVSKQRWVCLSVFAFISGVLVSNTVNEFKQKGFKLGDVGDGGDNYNEVKPGLAIYFGGVGAVACFLSMACMIAILNIQTQCCIASSDTSTVSQVDCIQPQTTECEMELQQQNENVKVENNA